MVVNYFGSGAFRLQSGETSILLDSLNNRLKADVALKTLVDAKDPRAEDGEGASIAFPGEYEIRGIEVAGFPVAAESTDTFIKTVFRVRWEDMTFVFLGHLSRPLDAMLMEECAEPDLIILPAGGGHFLEPEVAAKIVKQLEAKVVIPSFCKSADEFAKSLGKKGEKLEKLVFKQKDIAGDKGRLVVLSAN